MKYDEFTTKTSTFPVFGDDVISTFSGSKALKSLQLNRWIKKGKLIRLKRGLYTLPYERRQVQFSPQWLSNSLYSPSYLSLEYALSWYDMIPERVNQMTSITVLKTASFKNPLGNFIYRSIKKELFFGFEEMLDAFQRPILMATREKALLDTIYLDKSWESSKKFVEQNIRLQQLQELRPRKLKEYAKKFGKKKILEAVELLMSMR